MDEDLESLTLVQVEVLEQTAPQVVGYATQAYWAKVRCFEPISLSDVPRHFPESSSVQWFSRLLFPDEIPRTYISEFKNLRYHHIQTQEAQRFFITKSTAPERIILRGLVVFDEPIEICNCPFDLSKWPHHLEK